MFRLLTLAFALIMTSQASAATHAHRIFSITNDTTDDCNAFVRAIAQRVESLHQVRVVASLCQTSGASDRLTGVISYEAAAALPEISTYTLGSTYAPKGIYRDKIACEQALAVESETFEQQTGLAPTYAFCSREPLSSRHSWYPYLTAFGEFQKKPGRSSWHSDAPHGATRDSMLAVLNSHFADRGIEFLHLTYHDGGASGDLSSFYYAPVDAERVALNGNTVATIPGLTACTETAARLQETQVSIGGNPLILAYCSSGYSNPSKFELVVLSEGLVFLDSIQDSRRFDSLESCEASRPAIEQELRSIHGDKLALTVCGHPRFSLTRGAPFFVIAAKRY